MNDYIVIKSADELVTSHEQTRAGFIEAALAKNKKAQPYIEQAKTLKSLAMQASSPSDLLNISEIRNGLLSASGLSDKSFKYFTEEDKTVAIKKLITEFLAPAGEKFVDELVYRFLLIKGDSLGGSMRNYVGSVAQNKLIRKILSLLTMQQIPFKIVYKNDKKSNKWQIITYVSLFEQVDDIAAIYWNLHPEKQSYDRVLFFNATIPLVSKNIDICLYKGDTDTFDSGNIINRNELAIMFGELKGGIDPAGADEHWKTGNTALERIRNAFSAYSIKTSFIAAAIENEMAKEIFEQLTSGTLSNAANLTVDKQLTAYCNWLIKL